MKDLCGNYELDCTAVVHELREFRTTYKDVHNMVDVGDLVKSTRNANTGYHKKQLLQNSEVEVSDTADVSDDERDCRNESESEEDDIVSTNRHAEISENTEQRWIAHSFIKPLRVVSEIASYPHLAVMFKILASLAVTSASAERTLSRVRIIKNRLRTTMLDDWFSALTILAAERDIMDNIIMDDIIITFTECSSRLRNHLL